jgi:hypothetical protein
MPDVDHTIHVERLDYESITVDGLSSRGCSSWATRVPWASGPST